MRSRAGICGACSMKPESTFECQSGEHHSRFVHYLKVLPVNHLTLENLLAQEKPSAFKGFLKRGLKVRKLTSIRILFETIAITEVKIVARHDRITAAPANISRSNRTEPGRGIS